MKFVNFNNSSVVTHIFKKIINNTLLCMIFTFNLKNKCRKIFSFTKY